MRIWDKLPVWVPFSFKIPKTKIDFEKQMKNILNDQSSENEFLGMTYKYHADAMLWPAVKYDLLKHPYLAVCGSNDPGVIGSDLFVQKAKIAGVPIEYLRINNLDHYIKNSVEATSKTFDWLERIIKDS